MLPAALIVYAATCTGDPLPGSGEGTTLAAFRQHGAYVVLDNLPGGCAIRALRIQR